MNMTTTMNINIAKYIAENIEIEGTEDDSKVNWENLQNLKTLRDNCVNKQFKGNLVFVCDIDVEKWEFFELLVAKAEKREADSCPEPGELICDNFWDKC